MPKAPATANLMKALRARSLAAVRAGIKADARQARHARTIVGAAGLAWQPGLALIHCHGAGLNTLGKGYRPLHALHQERPHGEARSSAERLVCLDRLLENGADPEPLGAWPPARAIVIAGLMGEPEYVKRLRKAGARMDGFAAAAPGDLKGVEKALRENGGFARERDRGGLTALQCCCGLRMPRARQLEIAGLVPASGADASARTKSWAHEPDAAHYGTRSPAAGLFDLLFRHGADPTEAIVHAVWAKRYDLARVALDRGVVLDRATDGDRPLINNLIRWGQIPQTMWMLEQGASPNRADARGRTAVHQAASRGNARLMQAAMDAGGDLSQRDHSGRTPIEVARLAKRENLRAVLAAATA